MRSQGGGNGETRKCPLYSPKTLFIDDAGADFAVQVISDTFKGKVRMLLNLEHLDFILSQNTVQRHRLIYSVLSDEFSQGLHALSLNTKTTEETQKFGAED